jgi:hypothetical protein
MAVTDMLETIKRYLQITAVAFWFCLLPLAVLQPAWAQTSDDEPALADRIRRGWSYQLRVVGFGMLTETADTSRNPGNRIMALPRDTAALQLRPDFKLEQDRLALSLQPRAEIYWESWTEGEKKGDSEWRDETFIHQWLARWQCTDAFFVSYGRENLQWGPAYLTSLSNPFFTDNGKSNPEMEVAAMDFARVVWVPNLTWSVSLIVNADPGRKEMAAEDFSKTYALKTDYTGSADYGSLILTYTEDVLDQVGGFYGRTVSDAVLIYTEGVLQRNPSGLYPQRAGNPLGYGMTSKQRDGDIWIGSWLAGGSYTLESGPTLTLEYLYYGPGYDADEAENFFDLLDRATQEIQAGTPLTPLSYATLGAAADPGLRFLGRNYLMLQYVQSDIADAVNLTLRWTRNLDDGSGRMNFIGEWFIGDHVQLFGVGTWDNGSDHSEFADIIDWQAMLGMIYFF